MQGDDRQSNLEIRRIARDSAEKLRALLGVFGTAFDDEATYNDAQPTSEYLEGLLASECFIALAAVINGEIVGGLAAYELPKFEQERSEIYIYDLAVDERFRRQHIASALIDELRSIATERGAWIVFVQADLDDDPAIALYSAFGTREDVIHFDIPPK